MLRKIFGIIALGIFGYGGYVAYTDYAAGLYYLSGEYDRMMNPYGIDPEAPQPSADDQAFHQSMFVADLHADTLKWERDLLERSHFGHADVPRLMEGNVAFQGFTIVTQSPMRMPWSQCVSGRSPDTNTLLSAMQGRPIFDVRARAFYQVERYKDAVERSRENGGTELRLIETAEDLHAFIGDRLSGQPVIGGILGIEGGHWVGGGPNASREAVRRDMRELYDAGVRMFAPNHRFDNNLSGSNEGCDAHGLTDQGREALKKAQELGMIVDLAHISSAGLRDAIEILDQPFTISHTGIRADCEDPCRPDRNLTDADLEQIVANDGVIGVGFWPQAIGPSVWRIAGVMEHIMEIGERLGVDDPSHAVALGSDYDGSVTPLIEVGHLDVLTSVMRQRDDPFSDEEIRNISGRNVCRLFANVLPGGDPQMASALCSDLDHAGISLAADSPSPPTSQPGNHGSGDGGSTAAPSPTGSGDLSLSRAGLLLTDAVAWIARTQSEMNHHLRGYLASGSSAGTWGSALIIMIGFGYGLLHAAGPGHGKVVVAAYYLANPGRIGRGVALGTAMAMIQSLSAIVIVTALIVLAGTAIADLFHRAKAVEALAYLMIFMLGMNMLVRCFRHGSTCAQCSGHHNDHVPHHERRDFWTMALAVGLRPCSGALILLLFTLVSGAYTVGVIATLAMGVGAAITIGLSAAGAIGVRRLATMWQPAGAGGEAWRIGAQSVGFAVQLLAAVTITAIGALFMMAAFLRMGIL